MFKPMGWLCAIHLSSVVSAHAADVQSETLSELYSLQNAAESADESQIDQVAPAVTRPSSSVSGLPVPITVITRKEIEASHAQDICNPLNLLHAVPWREGLFASTANDISEIALCGVSCIKRGRLSGLWIMIIAVAMLVFTTAAVVTADARWVQDQTGRKLWIPDKPLRVVSLAPSITEIIFALGEGARIQGVTQHCDFPPEALSLPRVGSYIHPDLEKIVALKPDLCIATRDGNPLDIVQRLQALHIPVYAVNPVNLTTVMDALLEIGALLNAKATAERMVNDMRARIAAVTSRVAGVPERPGVFLQIGVSPIVSVGSDTFIDELITLAGGRNLAAGPAAYPRFSREQVLTLNPDVLIITSMTRGQDFNAVASAWRQWKEISAVRSQRVFVVDSNVFDRPGPRLVEGLEILAHDIHPDLF